MARHRRLKCRRGGLSLTEVAIATAIVGFMVVGALSSAGAVFRTRKLNAQPLAGPGLAQELLDEITALPYEDPQLPGGSIGLNTGESSSTRADFDDVDDYNNWSSNDARSRNGTAFTGFTDWDADVQVAWAQIADPTANSGTDSGLKRITVTITNPDGLATTVIGLRARYGCLEQKAVAASTAVAGVGAELRVGAAARAERWGSRPANLANDVN